jgi:hypothetical protein
LTEGRSCQRGQIGQVLGMIRPKNSGSDCSMGASSRENSFNSAYTHRFDGPLRVHNQDTHQ